MEPSCLARLLHCVAECDAEEAGAAPRMPAPDAAFAAALSALPEVPIPIAAALHIAKSPDGYMFAAVQSTYLEAYGGAAVAATARTLADNLRAALSGPPLR